jgi:hypothetical protein
METTQQFQESAQHLQERIGPQLAQAKENLEELNARAIRFIKERPGTCLLGALAVGFLIGKIASR